MPGNGAHAGADARRAAAAVLLVAVAAMGLRAGGAFPAAGSREILGVSGRAVYWILAAGEAVLALAGAALLIARLIWARKKGVPLRRNRRSLWWLLLLPLATFGLSHTLAVLRRHPAAAPSPAASHPAVAASGHAHLPPGSPGPLLVTFALVALAAAALIMFRRRRPAAPVPWAAAPGPDSAPVAAALAAGERALHDDPDPRTAIIGCYAAMERSLAGAGSAPRASDTPAELLTRASGLVRPAWAAVLTGLFRQARYSSHPMTEADRDAAIAALAQVRADLGGAA
jgi:hypothetical protein